ncbi:hypothetical protein BDW42DRAFT_168037 [Aspergillus taichungensis]|uniref:BTB domain-containing protein n=1 Tax=Aspergillus taichungensis TaxID=482145 RepID=A0A2J5HWT2_9EURO|nr:hypothetical protein BDW42DRAFT_168037 [Aspergillus taichungensis]
MAKPKKGSKKTAIKRVAPLSPPPPSVVDYNQPLKSPYVRFTILRICHDCYQIPTHYLDAYSKLRPGPYSTEICLSDIDKDIGHTLVHFLYEGCYETLQVPVEDSTHGVRLEFQRALQVYYAADVYEIHGLGALAKRYIEKLGDVLSISTILQAVRKVHSRLPPNETWLHNYLHAKLQGAFDADEDIFSRDEFYQGLGDENVCTQTVMKMVVKIYAGAVSSLRARGTESSDVELHIDPSDPPTPVQSGLETVAEDLSAGPVEADEVPVEACVEELCDLPTATPLEYCDQPVEQQPISVF